jgi:hypothetical protein
MIVSLSSIKGVDGQLKAPKLEFEIADTTPTSSTIRIKHGGNQIIAVLDEELRLVTCRNESGWMV